VSTVGEEAVLAEPTVGELFSLDGRVALVTGGSAGLGRSIALGLAQAGAETVLASRSLAACQEAAAQLGSDTGRTSVGVTLDVTDEGSVAATFAEVGRRFGRLDVLVNCAGLNSRHLVADCPAEVFQRVVEINLFGTWLCCREAGRVMAPAGRGSVINLGSALSAIGMPARTPYCASKAGIIGLTQTLALEWAGSGLRCNALCPGPFRTAMNAPVMADPAREAGLLARIALNRWAELVEIRGPAVFLASDASSYMTGAALYVDGGWTAA
jgi:NAD(P)-dependent dehydrogenase (short-subunit alcohol dehydrogenase family)